MVYPRGVLMAVCYIEGFSVLTLDGTVVGHVVDSTITFTAAPVNAGPITISYEHPIPRQLLDLSIVRSRPEMTRPWVQRNQAPRSPRRGR